MPYDGGKGVLGQKFVGSRRVVAVKGAGEDWAAYEGGPDMNTAQVCSSGSKLMEDIAVLLFPEVASEYRYRQ